MTKNNTQMTISETIETPNVALIRVDQMYESLRYNDYSAVNGLGEIVDNSVEARSSHIYVKCIIEKVRKPGKKRATDEITEIAVIDDGCGMDGAVLQRCLALGETFRTNQDGKKGIGRFGMGMTLGSISLARKVEVYSRAHRQDPFLYTYIDLDEIKDGNLIHIPVSTPKDPPSEYSNVLNDSSGTIVVLTKCDRIDENIEGFANYLGRTYRKFIERGLEIRLNDDIVYLHDPLYLAGPTVFDVKRLEMEGITDAKATPLGEEVRIPLEIPETDGETADVVIRMSLLPKEWRMESGSGGSADAKKRKIDKNEGFSVLRADREVLYGIIPRILGASDTSRVEKIDRWWGCEISFPPELDDYFQVRYIKRGAEPIGSLRDQIKRAIWGTVKCARAEIQQDWSKKQAEDDTQSGVFYGAEEAMAKADATLPRANKRGKQLTEDENERELNKLVSAALGSDAADKEKKKDKAEEIKKKPYSIEPVEYPSTVLFEPVHLMNSTVIKLNVNHPFYKNILLPLCGDIKEVGEDNDDTPVSSAEAQRKRDLKNAILLLLFSYARAESMFDDSADSILAHLRSHWGTTLAAALNEYSKGGQL